VAGPAEQRVDDLVTVIVPARNEERSIDRTLESVVGQTYRQLQIVVVDDGSTDRTAEITRARIAADPRIELVSTRGAGIPGALNAGLAVARGTWLVRVDAHATVGQDYVSRLVRHLQQGGWGGVGGRKDGVGETAAGRAIAAALGSRFGVGNSKYHYAVEPEEVDHLPFGAYPVDLVRRLGGWDERLAANEDYEFDYRLRRSGERLLLDPSIVITWKSRQSVPELWRQYVRYGRGKADVAVLHPASLRVRHLAAPMLVAWMAAASVVAVRRPRSAIAMMSPYAAVLVAASAVTARRLEEPDAAVHVPAAFLAMHLGWGLGFWRGLLARARTPLVPRGGTAAPGRRDDGAARPASQTGPGAETTDVVLQ
jgi:cellulose synthase/poly-beta-1,6-N-acetylglucosamine synthase-like glycosyltransferase